MKIAIYSDLHLEMFPFTDESLKCNADVLVLAGDIIACIHHDETMFETLKHLVSEWKDRPIIYVLGNHEYYSSLKNDMNSVVKTFEEYTDKNIPNMTVLENSTKVIDDVIFYGGTGWTDFNKGNYINMQEAQLRMNDFRMIFSEDQKKITPFDLKKMHDVFMKSLKKFNNDSKYNHLKRVLIMHHSPEFFQEGSRYVWNKITSAFSCTDFTENHVNNLKMIIHGHDHDHNRKNELWGCPIYTNQRGYSISGHDKYECEGFNKNGLIINV